MYLESMLPYGASSASHALCHVSEAALHLFQRAGMPIKRPLQGNSQRRGACDTLIYTTARPLLSDTGERNDRAGLDRKHSLFAGRPILQLYIATRATTPSHLPRAFGSSRLFLFLISTYCFLELSFLDLII